MSQDYFGIQGQTDVVNPIVRPNPQMDLLKSLIEDPVKRDQITTGLAQQGSPPPGMDEGMVNQDQYGGGGEFAAQVPVDPAVFNQEPQPPQSEEELVQNKSAWESIMDKLANPDNKSLALMQFAAQVAQPLNQDENLFQRTVSAGASTLGGLKQAQDNDATSALNTRKTNAGISLTQEQAAAQKQLTGDRQGSETARLANTEADTSLKNSQARLNDRKPVGGAGSGGSSAAVITTLGKNAWILDQQREARGEETLYGSEEDAIDKWGQFYINKGKIPGLESLGAAVAVLPKQNQIEATAAVEAMLQKFNAGKVAVGNLPRKGAGNNQSQEPRVDGRIVPPISELDPKVWKAAATDARKKAWLIKAYGRDVVASKMKGVANAK